jgi:hypothetical protein
MRSGTRSRDGKFNISHVTRWGGRPLAAGGFAARHSLYGAISASKNLWRAELDPVSVRNQHNSNLVQVAFVSGMCRNGTWLQEKEGKRSKAAYGHVPCQRALEHALEQ